MYCRIQNGYIYAQYNIHYRINFNLLSWYEEGSKQINKQEWGAFFFFLKTTLLKELSHKIRLHLKICSSHHCGAMTHRAPPGPKPCTKHIQRMEKCGCKLCSLCPDSFSFHAMGVKCMVSKEVHLACSRAYKMHNIHMLIKAMAVTKHAG